MVVIEVRGKPEYLTKDFLEERTGTSNKPNSHMTPSPGIEPGSHGWEASALTIGKKRRGFSSTANI